MRGAKEGLLSHTSRNRLDTVRCAAHNGNVKQLVEQFMRQFERQWGAKTLAQLRDEAKAEATGVVYESLRGDNNQPRIAIVACFTSSSAIKTLEDCVDLTVGGFEQDWTTYTIASMVEETMRGDGLSFQDQRDSTFERTSVILCGAAPKGVQIIEIILGLSPGKF